MESNHKIKLVKWLSRLYVSSLKCSFMRSQRTTEPKPIYRKPKLLSFFQYISTNLQVITSFTGICSIFLSYFRRW